MDVETTEQTTEATNDQATRDDLIAATAAAREAAGGETTETVTEPVTDAPAVAETAAVPAEPDPDAKLADILKRREEGHAKRRDAEAYADQVRRRADADAEKRIEEARTEAKRIADQELADLRARFKASPTETLRALGDPDAITDAVMREGSPEERARRQQEAEIAKLREDAKKGDQALQQVAEIRNERIKEINEQRYTSARDSFLTKFATEEAAPYLHARCDSVDDLFTRAHKLCLEWEADGLVKGKEFDERDLVRHLEKQSRERFEKTLPNAAQQVSAAGSATGQGVATKVTANGTRTLAASTGSERRTSPRPFHEMNPDEQRQTLIDEAAAARKANPDATM